MKYNTGFKVPYNGDDSNVLINTPLHIFIYTHIRNKCNILNYLHSRMKLARYDNTSTMQETVETCSCMYI